MAKLIKYLAVLVSLLFGLTYLFHAEIIGVTTKYTLVTIHKTDCSFEINSKGYRGAFTEKCVGQVFDAIGNSWEVLSNCPSYTEGWQVIMTTGISWYSDRKKHSINCDNYIEFNNKQMKRMTLKERNALFWTQINSNMTESNK